MTHPWSRWRFVAVTWTRNDRGHTVRFARFRDGWLAGINRAQYKALVAAGIPERPWRGWPRHRHGEHASRGPWVADVVKQTLRMEAA